MYSISPLIYSFKAFNPEVLTDYQFNQLMGKNICPYCGEDKNVFVLIDNSTIYLKQCGSCKRVYLLGY